MPGGGEGGEAGELGKCWSHSAHQRGLKASHGWELPGAVVNRPRRLALPPVHGFEPCWPCCLPPQGNHTKILDAKARQTQEQEQERWWAPSGERGRPGRGGMSSMLLQRYRVGVVSVSCSGLERSNVHFSCIAPYLLSCVGAGFATPAEAASLDEWAREASEHAAAQLADAAAELEDALAAGSQDEQ